ncbi:MAG: DNA repair protein RecN [Firmicutes bacterium]|nr:DNA repair protein RecN [Bacillota bacterium]
MIQRILIRNFAIIEHLDIEFHDGLNIVTGETGAGKSIVIEAVSLALGSRADTAFVRSGQEKAIVQMVADDGGREVILTREVSRAGRNICKINGDMVTLAELSALSRRLADIHGQYDHQSLLDPAAHIRLLDRYRSDTIGPAKEAVASCYRAYDDLRRQIQALDRQLAEDMRQQDFMAFELEELDKADLRIGEDEALEEEISRLQHSEQIYADLSAAYAIAEGGSDGYGASGGYGSSGSGAYGSSAGIGGESALLPSLRQMADHLAAAGEWTEEVRALSERVSGLYYELEDICTEVRANRDQAVFSPEDLDRAIGRLDLLSRLKQKHGKTIDELIAYREELRDRLADVSDSGERRQKLQQELLLRTEELKDSCLRLSTARKEAASGLEEQVSRELSELNFGESRFSIAFSASEEFSPEGTDIVEFLISTNRGEDLKPLAKIASGGEMSRIMLAFKKVIGDYDEIPTMIFDEIDSGISGIAASVVGQKLRQIAANHQIICITHLPQIAACGDHHYRISKDSDEKMTYTQVTELSPAERITEIARLLGGANVTETTLASAEELLRASAG